MESMSRRVSNRDTDGEVCPVLPLAAWDSAEPSTGVTAKKGMLKDDYQKHIVPKQDAA